MIGLDIWLALICAKRSIPLDSLILEENTTANTTVAKAKSVKSPFFGANDFAFAYALA
jgi:hypothetical protein